ncbi:hypothetical protein MTR_4g010310 [Medicago truncatula]|uniref:Uncharacterized protein n=1 Tax=Medicago truncatula TaxID=3880 RepID=G7JGZ3_MEDTR|nr:hypothetical protein MTR_4g010310 [Medicago truncatula]
MCSSMEGWKSVQTTQQPIKLPSPAVKDLSQGERPSTKASPSKPLLCNCSNFNRSDFDPATAKTTVVLLSFGVFYWFLL